MLVLSCHHFASLPPQLHLLVQARLASTFTSGTPPFPYPRKPYPTPYEIFHLAPGAPQSAIKARYYELVRVHHPDTPHARALPPHVCRARFQAITAAYESLTGRARHRHTVHAPPAGPSSPAGRAGAAHGGHGHARHGPGHEWAHARAAGRDVDDRVKDRIIVAVGLAAIAVGFAPLVYMSPLGVVDQRHRAAVHNLAQARRDARAFGGERLREIRKRARMQQLEAEMRERCEDGGR